MNLYPYLPSFHLIWLKFVQNSAGRLWPSWNQGQLRRCMTLIRALMVLWSVWYSDSTEQLDKSVNCVLQHTACSFNRGGVCLLRGTDWCPKCNSCCNWSAVAQAVCRRPVKAETLVRYQVSPSEVCDRQSNSGTSFPPSISVFPCPYHSTNVPYSPSSTCCS